MPTGIKNNKSVKLQVRVPHELSNDLLLTKESDESISKYINTALEKETLSRLQKIADEKNVSIEAIRKSLLKNISE